MACKTRWYICLKSYFKTGVYFSMVPSLLSGIASHLFFNHMIYKYLTCYSYSKNFSSKINYSHSGNNVHGPKSQIKDPGQKSEYQWKVLCIRNIYTKIILWIYIEITIHIIVRTLFLNGVFICSEPSKTCYCEK